MVLHFGYILGISRIDTPYFATVSEQEDYFDAHEVISIDTTFYPPHYLNEIKVDSEDIDFNTQVNYLWFTYNDKTYYYFIDSIEYINETVASIHIVMDTIQTYMFNIKISNAIIERKFINRWIYHDNQWKINRSYIRENVTEGYFLTNSLTVHNNDKTKWMYVIKSTELQSSKNTACKVAVDVDWSNNPVTTKINAPASPINILFYPYVTCILHLYNSNYYCNGAEGVVRLGQKDWCVDIFLVPFNPFKYLYFTGDENNLTISCDSHSEQLSDGSIATNTFDYVVDGVTNPNDETNTFPAFLSGFDLHDTDNFGTIKGTTNVILTKSYVSSSLPPVGRQTNLDVTNDFDKSYMPMLIDENYQRITFGSNSNNTTYPLSVLTSPVVYSKYYADLINAKCVYTLDENTLFLDKYRVTVTDNNVFGLEMKNSPWVTYVSQNRARWAGAIGETAVDIISKGVNVGLRNAELSSEIDDVIKDTRHYTPKTGKMKKKYQRAIDARKRDIEFNTSTGIADMTSRSIGGVLGQVIQDANNYTKPSTVHQQGNTAPLFTPEWEIYTKWEVVRDIDVCANYYHRNGYLVNEYINENDNIFGYVNTRFYFNVLKMKDVDLHLVNVIEDNETLDSVEERLNKGVRLWNVYAPRRYIYNLDIVDLYNFSQFYKGDKITFTIVTSTGRMVIEGIIAEDCVPYAGGYRATIIAGKATRDYISDYTAQFLTLSYRGNTGQYKYRDLQITDTDTEIIGNFDKDNVEKDFIN